MTASVFIPRPELLSSFGLIRRLCKPRCGEEAVLSFDGQCLHIELGGMGVTPPARGEWSGQARVAAIFIVALAKVPPSGDTIEFRVENGELHIGTSVAACVWQPAWSRSIDLPENASDEQILALPLQYEMPEIIASGYERLLQRAEKKRALAIAKALAAVSEFGVTREEIQALVLGAFRRKISK